MKKGKKNVLAYYHLGCGYSVCNRTIEENGDYLSIAWINPYRAIKWRNKHRATPEQIEEIEHFAKTDDGTISVTQDTKIFKTRP